MALPLSPATAGSEWKVENLLLFIPDCALFYGLPCEAVFYSKEI